MKQANPCRSQSYYEEFNDIMENVFDEMGSINLNPFSHLDINTYPEYSFGIVSGPFNNEKELVITIWEDLCNPPDFFSANQGVSHFAVLEVKETLSATIKFPLENFTQEVLVEFLQLKGRQRFHYDLALFIVSNTNKEVDIDSW